MQRIGSALGMKTSSSSGTVPISEEDTTESPVSPSPRLVRHESLDTGTPKQNGSVASSLHVKFTVGASDDEDDEPHYRRPRSRKNSSFGILDLNEDWITRNHFLEKLEADSLQSDVIQAKLAEIAEDTVKEKETCRRKLAKHMTTTAFTIFILVIALLDATVTITAVILQIHSEHDEIIVRREQHKKFSKFTKLAYGNKVDLDNVLSGKEMIDRVEKYLNKTQNATASAANATKNIHKRDVSEEQQYYKTIEISRRGHDSRQGRSAKGQGRRKRRSETADDKHRGERALVRRKRAAATAADGTPLFESKTALTLANVAHNLHYCSIALLSILLIEVFVKIFALGCEFFKSKVEVIDMIIVSVAFFLDVYFIDGVMDNVAATILLFIWQMIRVCTTLILQDRKRVDFLLDVVRDSNDANKKKVQEYQERNNSLETAVQRLTAVAKYNGATEAEIKRCVDIIVTVNKVEETKKSPKKPMFKSLQSVFTNVKKRRKKKAGFDLDQTESTDSKSNPPKRRLSSTDLNVQLVHRQRMASHANIHPSKTHRHSLHILHSLHHHRHDRRKLHDTDDIKQNGDYHPEHGSGEGSFRSPVNRRRLHLLGGHTNLEHEEDLTSPRFTFVSSFSPAQSPSVSRTNSILKDCSSPRFKKEDVCSPNVSRSSSLSRSQNDSGFDNCGFSKADEHQERGKPSDIKGSVNGDVGIGDVRGNLPMNKEGDRGVNSDGTGGKEGDSNDVMFKNSGDTKSERERERSRFSDSVTEASSPHSNTNHMKTDDSCQKKLHGILKHPSFEVQPADNQNKPSDQAHSPSVNTAIINDDDEDTGL